MDDNLPEFLTDPAEFYVEVVEGPLGVNKSYEIPAATDADYKANRDTEYRVLKSASERAQCMSYKTSPEQNTHT